MNGYSGKILIVDLTRSQIEQETIDVHDLQKFIGGMGMNLKLMHTYAKRGVGALDPENTVVLGTGPVVGTMVPSASKVFVTTKQPLNNCIGTAAAGMNFGLMLKRAGFDHVVIKGRSERPVVLVITNETVELKDAQDLWGQDIASTTHALWRDLRGNDGSVMAIGPAGENGVSFSMMLVDNIASLGKGGLASVLGSKNLKGIVASGGQGIEVAEGKRLMEIVTPIFSAMRNSPKREILMKYGSMAGWQHWSEVAGIPYKDWTEIFPRTPLREIFGPEAYLKNVNTKRIACPTCPLPCKECFTYEGEKGEAKTYAGSFIGRVTAFGARGGVQSIREMLICHDLCNRLGLDTYSTGAAIDYAVKLYEDGLLKSSDAGFALKRDFATTERLIRLIANREGIGALLASGFSEMGKNFGREFEAQIKGADFIFDARCYRLGTYEFEQIVNPRGGHQHAGGSPTYGARNFPVSGMKEFSRVIAVPAPSMEKIFADPDGFNVARLTKHCEDWYAVFSLMGVCSRKNIKGYYSMESLADILSNVTGFAINGQGLKQAGERAWNLLKLLNVGEGFTREQDRMPRNWFKPLKDGDKELVMQDYYGRAAIGQQDLDLLLDDYYDEHGWCSQHGVPTRQKIVEMGLHAEWEELKRQDSIPPGSCHLD